MARISTATKADYSDLRIPGQFKPRRTLEEAPFRFWVKWMLSLVPGLKAEDLIPTRADLELISELAYSVDELGNALAAEIVKNPKIARQLEKGLAEGIASIENPSPVLVEFLEYYENFPDFREPCAEGAKPRREQSLNDVPESLAFLGEGVGLSVGFFVGANYPAVGRSIVSTGSVASGPSRMIQTMKFGFDIGAPGAFRKFGPGIQTCAKVRLAHAFARMQIARGKLEWDENYYGKIISEFDNMIFLSGMFAMSYAFGSQVGMDNNTIFRATQYGLNAPRALMDFEPRQMLRFFVMVLAHLDDSPESARQVVHSFLTNKHYKPVKTRRQRLEKELTFLTANLYTRFSYGNRMADEIGLARTHRGVPLAPLAVAANWAAPRMMPLFASPVAGAAASSAARLSAPLIKRAMRKKPSAKAKKPQTNFGGYTGSFGAFAGHERAQPA